MPTVVKMYRALYAVVTPQHQNKTKTTTKNNKKKTLLTLLYLTYGNKSYIPDK